MDEDNSNDGEVMVKPKAASVVHFFSNGFDISYSKGHSRNGYCLSNASLNV